MSKSVVSAATHRGEAPGAERAPSYINLTGQHSLPKVNERVLAIDEEITIRLTRDCYVCFSHRCHPLYTALYPVAGGYLTNSIPAE